MYQLGRLPAADYRDGRHLMAVEMPDKIDQKIVRKSWRTGKTLDQNGFPHCVAYAWKQFLMSTPIQTVKNAPDPATIYHEAQLVDEWAGESYDGTSVRAGAKVLSTRGHISEYLWAWDVETIANWVLTRGTVVMGTSWYDSMFEPDKEGYIRIGGPFVGGHAWLIYGVDKKKAFFRMKNSWSNSWGNKGTALISFENVDELVRDWGEACTATEKKL